MTNRELAYYVKDILKLFSDDSVYEDEHVLFIASKLRSMLLKKYYDTPKKVVPDSNYQTICLDLVYEDDGYNICGYGDYLISTIEIPQVMSIGTNTVYTVNYFTGNIEMIPRERFKYIGNNKYMPNLIFATIGPNNHLYLKSSNKQFLRLEKVKFTAIFEDASKASELACESELNEQEPSQIGEDNCTILDNEFPLEEALIPELIELTIKQLVFGTMRPADKKNDASDSLSELQTYINNALKERYRKDVNGE